MIAIQWNPERKQLRQFAGIWFPAFCALVGWSIARKTGHWHEVEIGWAVAGVISLVGLVFPPFIRPIFVGLILLTYPIGWVVSHLLLGLIFFGVVAPIGLILRLMGHDSLSLKLPATRTMWKSPAGKTDVASYLRQS
jgi:hypothetical protein